MSLAQRLVASLFGLAVFGLVALSLIPRREPPLAVQASTVSVGPITRKVIAAGKLQAATEIKVSSNLSGDLLRLTVKEGDTVKKGELLAQIDSRRYSAQVRQQEASRRGAAAEFDLEKVQVARLEAEATRVRTLVQSGNASAAEQERAEADLAGEKARLDAAQQHIAQADASLSEARHFLELTTLYAPIDGIVTSRLKQVGERVRGSDFSEDVIVVISTLSAMEARVEVGEHEVVYLHEGDHAEVEVDAFPDKKFAAEAIEIARIATIKNAGSEAEVITFPVRLTLTESVPGALPGMSAQATIHTETHERAVRVPIQAVTVRTEAQLDAKKLTASAKSPLKKVVFVIDQDVARVRRVETGLADENQIEIVSGIKEGETVIEGPYRILARELQDGRAVKREAVSAGQ